MSTLPKNHIVVLILLLTCSACNRPQTIDEQLVEVTATIHSNPANVPLRFRRISLYSEKYVGDTTGERDHHIEEDLRAILDIDPENAQAHYYRGWMLMHVDPHASITSFSNAIKWNSGYYQAYGMRAFAYMHPGGSLDSAADDLTSSLVLHSDRTTRNLRAQVFEALGDDERAVADYRELYASDDHSPAFLRALARLLIVQGKQDEARDLIAGTRTADLSLAFFRGMISFRSRDLQAALREFIVYRDYEEAAGSGPGTAGAAYFALARVRSRLGNMQDAGVDLQNAIHHGWYDIGLLDRREIGERELLALAASVPVDTLLRHRLRTILERRVMTSEEDLRLVSMRMEQISLEPSRQEEYRKLVALGLGSVWTRHK